MKKLKDYKWLIGITALWLALDLLTKRWVQSSHFEPWTFIENGFYFSHHQNTGIAFGLPVPMPLQIIGSLILLGILMDMAIKWGKNAFLNQALFGIIIGGGLGNFISRILTGSVTDFIVLKPIPAFNIADIGITVGLALVLLTNIEKIKTQK